MTVKVKTTFTNKFAPEQVIEITTNVTDRMEDRKLHKRAYGYMKNIAKFDREHTRIGTWNGKQISLWNIKTEVIE